MAQLRLSISDIEFSDDEAEPIMLDSLSRFTVPNLSKLKLSIMAEEDEEEAKESIFMSSMERKIAQSTRAVSKVNYKFPKMSSPLTRPVNLDELLTGNIDEGFIESEWKALGKIANAPEMDKIAYHPSPKVAKNRNRYGLVLPNSNTRVKLKKSPFPDQNLDYINANFISDSLYSTPRQYIATQAPIEESIADFWCMVAEQHVSMIVMLTQCIETNKEKSVAYWPSEINVEMSVCGGRKIILLGENNITNSSGCIIAKLRRIRLKHASLSKVVTHVQFLSWPDHSTPEVEDYCHFLEEYRVHRDLSEKKNISCAPIVVHCTAGLGRTGTFIAIEILLDHIQNCFSSTNLSQASFNPGALVYELRKHRNKMVQTLSQYEFIYSFLRYCFVNRKLLMFPHQSPTSSELNYSSRRRSSSKRIRTTRDVDKRMFAFESSESDVKPCSGAGDRRPSRQSISRFRFSVDGTDN